MQRTVEQILTSYKKCTEDILELLKREEFDSLQAEMEKRQCILDNIISLGDKKNEVKKYYKKFGINDIENEARELMQKKAVLIKEKLRDISVKKTASTAYGNIGSSAKIFSKKI